MLSQRHFANSYSHLSSALLTVFLFLALGGAKTALAAAAASGETVISIPTLMFIAVSFGFSLLCTAWIFFRVSGALFNPAITLSLALVGAVSYSRAAFLVVAEVLGGIVGAALVEALTEGGVEMVITRLGSGVGRVQGVSSGKGDCRSAAATELDDVDGT